LKILSLIFGQFGALTMADKVAIASLASAHERCRHEQLQPDCLLGVLHPPVVHTGMSNGMTKQATAASAECENC
jgi:hypothetical protein